MQPDPADICSSCGLPHYKPRIVKRNGLPVHVLVRARCESQLIDRRVFSNWKSRSEDVTHTVQPSEKP